MGNSSTAEYAKDEDVFERFSENEIKLLRKNYEANNLWSEVKIRDCIKTKLPSQISDNFLWFLNKEFQYNKQSGWFPKLVQKLTKGTIEELAMSSFYIIAKEESPMNVVCLRDFLIQMMMNFYDGVDIKSTFKVNELDCKNFINMLTNNFPENITTSEFNDQLHRNSLLVDFLQYRFYMIIFGQPLEITESLKGSMANFIPHICIEPKNFSTDMINVPLATSIFINSKLPLECQYKWRLLFSSKIHGESFSKLCSNIVSKGPTVLFIEDNKGNKFGGFASVSWEFNSQFLGTKRCFLFSSHPQMEVYTPTGYNEHYMYLNIGQETMPNGLGMGGQHNHFGLYLDSEFGMGHSKAKSTTYGNPQLSVDETFKINCLEVWGAGEEPKVNSDEEIEESVLDKHLDAQALLEIAGKPRVSEGLREADPEADIPESKELYHAHDPMQ